LDFLICAFDIVSEFDIRISNLGSSLGASWFTASPLRQVPTTGKSALLLVFAEKLNTSIDATTVPFAIAVDI
jgi:hypothetical protein